MRHALYVVFIFLSAIDFVWAVPGEVVSKDRAGMVMIADGPFVRGSVARKGDVHERPLRTLSHRSFLGHQASNA